MVASYRWSFCSNGLRGCHWAYESACFIRAVLVRLFNDDDLPALTNLRACLSVHVNSLVVSEVKLAALREELLVHMDDFAEPAAFDEHVAMVRNFLLVLVEEVLRCHGMKEAVTFNLSLCCPAVLLSSYTDVLTNEVEQFTDLLMDLRKITVTEKRRLGGSFGSFLTNYRRDATEVVVDSCSSAVDILRACDSVYSQRLFRFLMCLGGNPLFPANLSCTSVGLLRGNVTTSVCASILSFLKAHRVRHFERVSGPLLEEISDSMSRFTALAEMTEDMLWDDVGIVSDEAYRQDLYRLMGFTEEGERAPSPEI